MTLQFIVIWSVAVKCVCVCVCGVYTAIENHYYTVESEAGQRRSETDPSVLWVA